MTSVQQQSLTIAQDPLDSKVVVGSLSRLTPVDLMPERYSRHMKILTKLKQIRQVQACRSPDSSRSYVVDVYTTSQSTTRIPTSLKTANSALAIAKGQHFTTLFNQADVHTEKQFADFVQLRDELYESCHTGPHLAAGCAAHLDASAASANQGRAAIHRVLVAISSLVSCDRLTSLSVPREAPAAALQTLDSTGLDAVEYVKYYYLIKPATLLNTSAWYNISASLRNCMQSSDTVIFCLGGEVLTSQGAEYLL
ncbi:hypothetical protein ON010_g1228 [Phytophthora cinnamomi]|nr:hypothetical protein ON010_g1228 [Phytophthora cinnamomi]